MLRAIALGRPGRAAFSVALQRYAARPPLPEGGDVPMPQVLWPFLKFLMPLGNSARSVKTVVVQTRDLYANPFVDRCAWGNGHFHEIAADR